MTLNKLDTLLEVARTTLNNIKSEPDAAARLGRYDISTAYLQTGEHMLQVLEHHQRRLIALQNERWALSQQINAGLQAVHEQFREHARLVLVAYRHDAQLRHDLAVDSISRRQWECVRQAVHFYREFEQRNLSLKSLGVSDREIQQTAATVDELWRLKEERLRLKSASEQGTQRRQRAHEALRRWLVDFRTVARVAFRDEPQRLEMFGIRVRSSVQPSNVVSDAVPTESPTLTEGNIVD